MIDDLDKKVIHFIQGDLPLDPQPFAKLAKKAGISEKQFIEKIRDLKKRGIIRRFGATLRHQQAGFRSNAMVAWFVPEERISQVGQLFAQFREITHCYQRNPQGQWIYNLYTMVHGNSPEQCRKIAEQMSKAAGIQTYELLFSKKEFLKTSMAYF